MSVEIIKKPELTNTKHRSQFFAKIPNPASVFPEFEIVPLARPRTHFDEPPLAFLMDMDGTTTTTEVLCIHAMEHTIRQAMGENGTGWSGLDPQKDYPNIIGNSTTRHVEYLVKTYGDSFRQKTLQDHFLQAANWTMKHGKDPKRIEETTHHCRKFGVSFSEEGVDMKLTKPTIQTFNEQVLACIDIYYRRYHEILAAIENNDRQFLESIPGIDTGKSLIEPMPGVAVTLALMKGLPGEEAKKLAEPLIQSSSFLKPGDNVSITQAGDILSKLANFFAKKPVKVGLVTSSIRYEAKIVLQKVFQEIQKEVQSWPLSGSTKKMLLQQFDSFHNYYDAFVTASDSSEIRLKPHRDLYSIALQTMGIPPTNFDRVAGFEDSESGTVAIRAAGVGLCTALPFAETGNHNFDAATVIAQGGLPEVLIHHNLFLSSLI